MVVYTQLHVGGLEMCLQLVPHAVADIDGAGGSQRVKWREKEQKTDGVFWTILKHNTRLEVKKKMREE